MNKALMTTCILIGGAVGAYVPALWGDADLLSPASILLSMVGSLLGIWLAVVINKRPG